MKLRHHLAVSTMWLAPIIVTASMLIARAQYAGIYPDRAAIYPETVSRAISEPIIGGWFRLVMIVAASMLLVALVLAYAYLRRRIEGRMEAASPLRSGLYGGLLYGGLFVSFTLQLIAVAGIIVLSQYTFPDHNRMHMIGSYMLFIGHGAGIGIATGILVATRSAGAPRVMNGVRSEAGAAFRPPGSDPVRIALGTGVVVLSLFYLAVFLTKDAITFIDIYAVRLIYTWLELAVIIAFLLFLASLSPAVYDEMERRHASAEPR